ncbi:hypothetical protein quinque_013408 [Culex quinquefasciatus]
MAGSSGHDDRKLNSTVADATITPSSLTVILDFSSTSPIWAFFDKPEKLAEFSNSLPMPSQPSTVFMSTGRGNALVDDLAEDVRRRVLAGVNNLEEIVLHALLDRNLLPEEQLINGHKLNLVRLVLPEPHRQSLLYVKHMQKFHPGEEIRTLAEMKRLAAIASALQQKEQNGEEEERLEEEFIEGEADAGVTYKLEEIEILGRHDGFE